MIVLIGRGYIGSEFAREMTSQNLDFVQIFHSDLASFWQAHEVFKQIVPELVINAGAFIPPQSVSFCDMYPAATIRGNVMFPTVVSAACADQGIPFAHISTGCLWSDGLAHSEDDPPTRAFTGHCGFYIGTKVLAEEQVSKTERHYIWRVRLPFDQFDNERNYLSKLANFKQAWIQENSVCHRRDFVKACLELWKIRGPYGTYNMTNPGELNVTDVLCQMQRRGIINKLPELIDRRDGECRLIGSKLLAAGVKIRHVSEALDESLQNWSK